MYDNTCFYVLTLMTRVVNTVIKTMYLHLFVFVKNGKSLVTSNALVRATEHMFGFSLKHLLQIEQTIFHAQIVVDNEAVQKETAAYQPIPEISSFLDEDGNDTMEQQIQANYQQIKQDIVELVENELIRIENDPELKHLLGGNEGEQA